MILSPTMVSAASVVSSDLTTAPQEQAVGETTGVMTKLLTRDQVEIITHFRFDRTIPAFKEFLCYNLFSGSTNDLLSKRL